MKFIQQLMEMAKSKNKRKREAKLARMKRLKTPTQDAKSNPVAKYAQTSGAGFHPTKGKETSGKRQRAEGKRQAMDY